MIKLIIFDFDGVIADTAELAVKTVNSMLAEERHDEKIGREEIREKGFKELVKEFKIPIYKVPIYINKGHQIFSREIRSAKAFTGIRNAILKLKNGCKLAIVSSNSKENVYSVLKNNSMEGVFDLIIAGVDVFGKASKMKKAVKIAGVRKDEAVCIGDEVRDIEAARKAGLKVIAATWGFNYGKLLERSKPDYVAESPDELLELIKSIQRG